MASKWLCQITADNKEYYLMTEEQQDEDDFEAFDLAISDGEHAWCGTVTSEDLDGFCRKVHMDYTDMLTQTRKALTKENVGSISFQYQVKSAANNLQLMWKKHISTENIKFQLGNTSLTKKADPSDVVRAIFDHSISSARQLQDKIKNLQSDNERLVSERASALKRLDKYVSAKEDTEQDMYSKFVVVLNDKKSKLRSLRRENDGLRSGGVSVPSSAHSEPGPSEWHTHGAAESGDETDDMSDAGADRGDVKKGYGSEYNTDEDDQVAPPSKKQRKVKVEHADSLDSSLMLDDGDNDDDIPITGRRRRRVANSNKKQTPSKPVIPKVPSSEQKGKPGTSRDSSRRGSMRKSASINSNRSSDNIEADDLLEDF